MVARLRRWTGWLRRLRTEQCSVVVAACSMLIALLSLGLTTYEAWAIRNHDRLSVQPRISLAYYFDDTGVGWRFSNVGLGPARIRGFKVFVDGISQRPVLEFSDIVFSTFNLDPGTKIKFTNIFAGDLLPSGHDGILAWIPTGPEATKVNAGRKRMYFELCYCSLYNQCWRFTNTTATPREGIRDDSCSTFSKDPPSIWWEP